MRVINLIFSSLLLLTFSCRKEGRENSSLGYQVFNVQNSGLPTNFVTKIAIDNQSNIWIGSFDKGLIKFDGRRWNIYNTQNSPLPNDSIMSLTVDKANKLWIGTKGGLASFDQQNWKVYNASNSRLKAKNILSVCADNLGRVWAGGTSPTSTGSGLYAFDGFQWQYYNQQNSLLPNDIVTALATDQNNTIWIGTAVWQGKGGLLKFNSGTWEIYHLSNSPIKYNKVMNISISSTNKLLLSSPAMVYSRPNIAEGYVQEFDGGANWTDISPYNPQLTLTNRVTASAYDRNNLIWVATSVDYICNTCEYALSRYDGQNWVVLSPKNRNFPRTFISDMKVDNANNLWVAAGDVGLIKVTQ